VNAGARRRRPAPSWIGAALPPASLALSVLALVPAAAAASAASDPDQVIFLKGGSLWLDQGDKTAPRELGTVPQELGVVTALQADPAGTTMLVGSDRGWFWSPLRSRETPGAFATLTFRKLACAPGPATLSSDGQRALCGTVAGTAMVIQLASGAQLSRSLPIEQTHLAGAGADARLIWADPHGVWASPLDTPKVVRQLAAEPPLRGLSVSPSGQRAVAVFAGPAHHGKEVVTQEMLYGFALDGLAVRRKAIQHGHALGWSGDGRWVLIQDGPAACIMAATGGQYKCWKGYRGVALSYDGHAALLLGNREDASHGRGAKLDKAASSKSTKARAPKERTARAEAVAAKSTPPAPKVLASATTVPSQPGTPAASARAARPTDIDTIIETIEGSADDGPDSDEPQGDDPSREDGASELPSGGELHLYRAALDGAFTLPPTRIDELSDRLSGGSAAADRPAVFLRALAIPLN
jgi:hypothetical protein